MPRPASRVALCQELARIRSLVRKADGRLPKEPAPGSRDAWARWWVQQAERALAQAEQAWDDPTTSEGE